MVQRNPTAGIILAAGESTRLGRPKQLLRLKDKYLLEWVLDASLNSTLSKIVLVLGYAHQKILKALQEKLQHPKIEIEVNPDFKKGQSQSLRVGLSKVKDDFAAVMFLLADQPMMDSATINLLLENFHAAGKDICAPTHRGKRKNPTIFSHRFYSQLMSISGDIGARKLIDENPERVLTVEIDNSLSFFDVDTQKDFRQLKELMSQ